MQRNLICTVALLLCASLLNAQSQQQTPQEKAVAIPIGSVVEAKLSQRRGKVKGQLVSVSETGVGIRTVEAGKIVEKSVAFADMQQFHHKKGSGNTAVKILAGVGIAFGVLLVIGAILSVGS